MFDCVISLLGKPNAESARAASVVEHLRPERRTTIRACEAGTSPA
jgi:hypothetical protein